MKSKKYLTFFMSVALMLTLCGCKSSDYKKAVELFESGDYAGAKEAFTALADYKDAKEYLTEIQYIEAVGLLESGDYSAAKDRFTALADYKDAKEYLTEIQYVEAIRLFDGGDYTGAITMFTELKDYKDSPDRLENAKNKLYEKAVYCFENKEFDEAIAILVQLDDFKDSKDLLVKVKEGRKEWQRIEARNKIIVEKMLSAADNRLHQKFDGDTSFTINDHTVSDFFYDDNTDEFASLINIHYTYYVSLFGNTYKDTATAYSFVSGSYSPSYRSATINSVDCSGPKSGSGMMTSMYKNWLEKHLFPEE